MSDAEMTLSDAAEIAREEAAKHSGDVRSALTMLVDAVSPGGRGSVRAAAVTAEPPFGEIAPEPEPLDPKAPPMVRGDSQEPLAWHYSKCNGLHINCAVLPETRNHGRPARALAVETRRLGECESLATFYVDGEARFIVVGGNFELVRRVAMAGVMKWLGMARRHCESASRRARKAAGTTPPEYPAA